MPATPSTLLHSRIETRDARVCVVGLGYVGLTLACAAARAGFGVVGIEANAGRLEQVRSGRFPFGNREPDLPDLLESHVSTGKLSVTDSYSVCATAHIIIIAVQTPVDEHTKRMIDAPLRSAASRLSRYLQRDALVILESTVEPGSTRDLLVPALEGGSGLSAAGDFLVAHCPERVMPGKLIANLASCSRVVGGWTEAAAGAAAAFYRTLTDGDIDITDCLTAEFVKTAENAYRDVQIAFANEVALLCEHLGANVYEVRELVNKSPMRAMHEPGGGVGGHCIPKDPWLLVGPSVGSVPIRVVSAAREVNDSMPRHVGELVRIGLLEHGRDVSGACVVLLGYSYLENSDDTRNSPSAAVAAWLRERGATVVIHDPVVADYGGDVYALAADADCLILMVRHDHYGSLEWASLAGRMRTPLVVDGRQVLAPAAASHAGLAYLSLGVGARCPRPAVALAAWGTASPWGGGEYGHTPGPSREKWSVKCP